MTIYFTELSLKTKITECEFQVFKNDVNHWTVTHIHESKDFLGSGGFKPPITKQNLEGN